MNLLFDVFCQMAGGQGVWVAARVVRGESLVSQRIPTNA